MRIGVLVTVATLVAARDSRSQSIAVGAQAIPLVTRAAPTAGRHDVTEAYLTQPVIMAHAAWSGLRAVGTLNLEGLTLQRGELNTGGYGEGYVDRRHPHAYVHELLAGYQVDRADWAASAFAGRGFAPFGSDDPMTRPFVKYPVNHHLAQVLERVVAIGAVRYRRVIAEAAVFNGDEPLAPKSVPEFGRVGDSKSLRLTALPLDGLELGVSGAVVASPEERSGHGLDQRKGSLVARFDRESSTRRFYALAELARTEERDGAVTTTTLSSALGEAAYCRDGFILAGRVERTDRPEEEPTLDPFRTARPATDLHNLGVSRWAIATLSIASPAVMRGMIAGRPFVELARASVTPGDPAGLFSAANRYGRSTMWMYSLGLRLHAGASHDRMDRYGAAMPSSPSISGMPEMPGMSMMHDAPSHPTSTSRCRQ